MIYQLGQIRAPLKNLLTVVNLLKFIQNIFLPFPYRYY
jgi:hypothetical protein